MQRSAEERFGEIYQRHVGAVTAYVRRRSASDLVEDVVAETFLVCWRKLEHVPHEPLPWLYAVARKSLANQRRAESRNERAGTGTDAPSLPQPVGDPVLARAFALLSEHDREILRLIAWEQLSLHDAAKTLGCSYVACRVRLHRARRRLAMHLDAFEAEATAATARPQPEGVTQ